MKITGHKTESIFERYAIKNTDDVKEALIKVSQFKKGKTVSIATAYATTPSRTRIVRQKRTRLQNMTDEQIFDERINRLRPLFDDLAAAQNRSDIEEIKQAKAKLEASGVEVADEAFIRRLTKG